METIIITLTVAIFAALAYFLYQRRKDSKGAGGRIDSDRPYKR